MRSPDRVIGENYLLRWHIIPRNKWFNIYLHHFLSSDYDGALHDHPWWNISIVLKGTYREYRKYSQAKIRWQWKWWAPWRITIRAPKTAHRVELINGEVWTLFITGPVLREWGFHCPKGWVHWKEFTEPTSNGNKIGKGCE